jgi:hypothetical protein
MLNDFVRLTDFILNVRPKTERTTGKQRKKLDNIGAFRSLTNMQIYWIH